MALVFPLGPSVGQQFTATNGIVYEWTSVGAWDRVNSVQTLRSGATASTSSARIPAGTTAERPGASLYIGQFRYNTQIGQLEYSDGINWLAADGLDNPASLFEAQQGIITTKYSSPQTSVPKDAGGMLGSAFIPAGTTTDRPLATAYTGQFRYNTQIPEFEYSNGVTWLPLSAEAKNVASLAEAQAGTITTKYSSPQTAVPKDASGMTGSAYLPAGTTAQRPAATGYAGQFRYNTQIPQLEYSDGTNWISVVNINNSVTSFNAGTTGFTPVAATSGAVTLAGTLNVANGGTGATTQAAALINLLPSQAGNSGKVLGTNGTNASWVAGGGGLPTNTLIYTSSGSYTATTTTKVWVLVVGGGGGGNGLGLPGGGPAASDGGGAAASWSYFNLVSGTTYNFTVGAPGIGGIDTGPGGVGTAGGSSSGFGMTVGGGGGGGYQGGITVAPGVNAGPGSGGNIANAGGAGSVGVYPDMFVPAGFGIGAAVTQQDFGGTYAGAGSGCVAILFF